MERSLTLAVIIKIVMHNSFQGRGSQGKADGKKKSDGKAKKKRRIVNE
jgi:hypothetical protein